MIVLYQSALRTLCGISFMAWGPRIIPAISHPSIDGIFILVISFPATKARASTAIYALLAGCVYCISMILASLKEQNVRKRTIISSFNYKKYNLIVLMSLSIVILAMWMMYMILSFILFKNQMTTSNGIAYMLNSLVFALCSLSIGFLIGNITQNKNAIGGIVNVVALGTSFLCGCFVPFDYMPDYVIKIAHILPTYYFVKNNETIKTIEAFGGNVLKPLLINGGIIVAFAILFIIITNCVSKKKERIA